MKNKRKIKAYKYQCGCGCICSKDEIFTARRTEHGKKIQRLRCIKHADLNIGEVICRTTICDKCYIEFPFAKWGGVPPKLCGECGPPEKREKARGKAKKLRSLSVDKAKTIKTTPVLKNAKNGDPNRWMCKHWDYKCYDFAALHNLATRPCKDCKDFEAAPQNIDPLANKYVDKSGGQRPGHRRKK